ncbi:MAG: DUF983 domain-containing protein [Sphaerobacter sp.]|nr:DUF983 domain-containing protein [Sphaerobacter sp.]
MSDVSKALLVLLRGLVRRCPSCGDPGTYQRWFFMRGRCPRCGLLFEREEGYWTGAMAINLIVTELIFAVVMVAWVIKAWPDVPMVPLLTVGLVLNGIVAVLFYPIARTIWIAIDLLLHPLEAEEIEETARLHHVRERSTGGL